MLSLTAVGIALALAITVVGCGSGGDGEGNQARAEAGQANGEGGQAAAEDGQTEVDDSLPPVEAAGTFDEVLRGLKAAAPSGKTYQAVLRARDLPPIEEAVVSEFCNFAWQIRVNREQRRLGNRGYIAYRITRYVTNREKKLIPPATAAMKQLQTVIDLGALKSSQLSGYVKACYR